MGSWLPAGHFTRNPIPTQFFLTLHYYLHYCITLSCKAQRLPMWQIPAESMRINQSACHFACYSETIVVHILIYIKNCCMLPLFIVIISDDIFQNGWQDLVCRQCLVNHLQNDVNKFVYFTSSIQHVQLQLAVCSVFVENGCCELWILIHVCDLCVHKYTELL